MPRIKNHAVSSSFSWFYFFFIFSLIIHLVRSSKMDSQYSQTLPGSNVNEYFVYPGVKPSRAELVRAISNEYLEAVKMFAMAGADLISAENGLTPLMLACQFPNSEVIEYFVEKKSNLNEIAQFDSSDKNVLRFFTLNRFVYPGTQKIPNKLYENHYTAISFLLFNHRISFKHKFKLLKQFIQNGADLNLQMNGETYLHLMAKENLIAEIVLLVKCGLDVNAENKNGLTAISTAVKYNQHAAISTLVTLQASLTAGKNNPLILAIEKDSGHLVQMLLEAGAFLPNQDTSWKHKSPKAYLVYADFIAKKQEETELFSPLIKF